MKTKIIIYSIKFPNDKYYIGITSRTLEQRQYRHYIDAFNRKEDTKVYRAFRKYGKENLGWFILEIVSNWKEACKREQHYISKYDSFATGYNSTLGGDGWWGHKHTEESKIKMRGPRPQTSAATKGNPKSEEHKKHLSEACMGRKISEEAKKKISNFMKKYKSNIEVRNAQAIALGGKPFKVFKLESKEYIGEWISQRQCARDLGLHQSDIGKCLRGRAIQYKGFIFRHIEEGTNNFNL